MGDASRRSREVTGDESSKLGIRHERIDPGHPEQNGRHERMHRDLRRETASLPATTLAKQQRLFDQCRARFNQERPHEALEQRTPHEFYEISPRHLPQPWWGKRPSIELTEGAGVVGLAAGVDAGGPHAASRAAPQRWILCMPDRRRGRRKDS